MTTFSPVDAADFERLGLYSPAAPNADTRLALLRYLVDRGATPEDLVAAEREHRLPVLASVLVRRQRAPRITPRQLAESSALSLETFDVVWRAAGLPAIDPDAPILFDSDQEVFAAFGAGAEFFGEEATLQFTRVVGAALATIADAATAIFGLTIEPEFEAGERDELEFTKLAEAASSMLVNQVPIVIAGLFRHHVEAAIDRYQAMGVGEHAVLAVGFLDVVRSTELTWDVGPVALGSALSDFERRAVEVIADHGGRLVKTIGDEVMFVATTPDNAAAIALELARFAASHPVLKAVRGSVAWGEAVRGFGDFYGPVVNRAARAVKEAEPGQVIVDEEFASALSPSSPVRALPLGERRLRGFNEPKPLFALEAVRDV
jgi:class 3 adenylate cyclase